VKTAPPSAPILAKLKDFQRSSANYVFRRLYTDPDPVDRFLLADEVGLGKTHVAKGVIASAVEHLWDKVERIDIVYICSNADIARQNIRRLRLDTQEEDNGFDLASRITLLPLHVKDLKSRRLNFVSFTPGTSLDMGNRAGIRNERELIYVLLRDAWGFRGVGPKNVLQGNMETQRWRTGLRNFEEALQPGGETTLDPTLAENFAAAAMAAPDLQARFSELCERFGRDRKYTLEDKRDRNVVVGKL
jgi:hypothetical protein